MVPATGPRAHGQYAAYYRSEAQAAPTERTVLHPPFHSSGMNGHRAPHATPRPRRAAP